MNWTLRLAQWVVALKLAKHRIPWFGLVRSLASGAVPRAVWRERMRFGCYQCPIFNKQRLTCRGVPKALSHLGCDCFVPFSALTAEPYQGGCWGRAVVGDTFGWGAYRFKSRFERWVSPFRFLLRR